jgi:aspartyl-tRNA(Asn)/glutamyl-tRNA(Gln) amidotransferase subunit B
MYLTWYELGTSGKTILRHIITHRSTALPSELARELSLLAMPSTSSSELEQLCQEAITALPEEAEVVRKSKGKGSKSNVINKLVGMVMKKSRGRADARAVRELLERMILDKQV